VVDFEQAAHEAVDELPPELRHAMSNVTRPRSGAPSLAHHFGISDERLIELDRY
jgi:predicted Zn-dependent protease with MMP-like domain